MEREKKEGLERDREKERELRRREREEREYRDMEREWEQRERAKEREKEKEKDLQKRPRDRRKDDLEYDEHDRKRRRSREYFRKKREREREREEDETDRVREIQEEEYRRREEERKLEERHSIDQQSPPTPVLTASPIDLSNKEGLDRSKLTNIALKLPANVITEKKKLVAAIAPGFNPEPEFDELYQKKKRELVTLESSLHEQSYSGKLEKVKAIIEKIPTEKEKLFAFILDWEIIQKKQIVKNKMEPWVEKKIVEYLGEKEHTLINFIVNNINQQVSPEKILEKLKLILDEEAEVFMVKMWRLLIFEMLTAAP